MAQQTPSIGSIHYSWTGSEWIPTTIYKITKSGKSFYASNVERGYGTFRPIPVGEFRPNPTFDEPIKEVKPTPLFN